MDYKTALFMLIAYLVGRFIGHVKGKGMNLFYIGPDEEKYQKAVIAIKTK